MKVKYIIYNKIILLLVSAFVLFALSDRSQSEPLEHFSNNQKLDNQSPLFSPNVGEEFVYAMTWGVIPAGSATLKVDSLIRCNDKDCYTIQISTKSNSFFDKIYKVRDQVRSSLTTSLNQSYYYDKDQQEGNFRRHDELIFDYIEGKVVLKRDGQIKNVLKIQQDGNLLDPLSVLYYTRSLDLHVGDSHKAYLTDGKEIYLININVIKRERVKTWVGTFDCLKIEPHMEKVEGIFHKKAKAKLYVWLTNDKRKIPVKLKSEALVGSFQGLLKKIK